MPFRSKAQVRKFGAMMSRGQISRETFHRWVRHTPDMSNLVERVRRVRERARRRRSQTHE